MLVADRERVRRVLLEMLAINSPSKDERRMADYVKHKLAEMGIESEEDGAGTEIEGTAGNIIAHIKGSKPGAVTILLSAHMDTVDATQSLNIVEEDGLVKSDGSTILGADDKAGIAAILEGVQSVMESGVEHGDIDLVFDASEETGLEGIRALDCGKLSARLAYVIDSQKPAAGITVSAPSHETITVVIEGRAAHAGMAPEEGVSAIVAASRAIGKMNLGRIDFETTANVGIIQGGKARNIIPDRVEVKAEARSRNREKLAAQVAHMKQVFEEETAAIGAKAVFSSECEYECYRWGEDTPVVRLAARASKRAGIEPHLMDGGGGSDANVLNVAGIPSVVIGVGYDGAHGHSEHIHIDDLVATSRFVAALILEAANGGA
jgi:tripeptide aminopeptidase